MDNNIEKRIQSLRDRLTYMQDIFAGKHKDNADLLEERLTAFAERARSGSLNDPYAELATVEDLFSYVERRLESSVTPMDRVRIVRHPQRICLRDILENVYDNFTEVGGQDEHSLDPSMLIARAVITRRRGKKIYTQSVMVIGQEKGHGAEFRNGGSVKPWGNAKALQYMRVAETEGIPIHAYIFTPGSFPIEDYPGAAQQIARNIYGMAGLRVPVVAVISEGGSGGAEAIGLADKRLMLSHGYYSVISPEGAAAIEGRLKAGQRATPELIEHCAEICTSRPRTICASAISTEWCRSRPWARGPGISTFSAPCARRSSGPRTKWSSPPARCLFSEGWPSRATAIRKSTWTSCTSAGACRPQPRTVCANAASRNFCASHARPRATAAPS